MFASKSFAKENYYNADSDSPYSDYDQPMKKASHSSTSSDYNDSTWSSASEQSASAQARRAALRKHTLQRAKVGEPIVAGSHWLAC